MRTDNSALERMPFRQYYPFVLIHLLKAPRWFFIQSRSNRGIGRPLRALFTSSLVFVTAAVVIVRPVNPILQAILWLVNAMGMVLVSSALSYILTLLIVRQRVSFTALLGVYAFSSAATLLLSWLPFALWLTEPWKWWLVATGLINRCSISRGRTVMVIGLTLVLLTLLFWAVLPPVETA